MNLRRLKSYFKVNPGTPFILAFMILLVSAGVLLLAGKSDEANATAVYAFYSIVLGIIIQIGVIVREGRKHSRSNDNKPSGTS
jgi:hypothetical protein